jgi:glucosamine-6-phosphate deaminase
MTIKIEIIQELDNLYKRALEIIEAELATGSTTFGLATGGTMEPLYEKIRESSLDFSQCTSFNLDEYVGLPTNHPESYYSFMKKQLFDVKPFAHSYLPNGEALDIVLEAKKYEEKLKHSKLDFQLLGVGVNGHIGFNEPGTSFQSVTHVVELTESTRKANSRFFKTMEEVPKKAITMGISSILQARSILLIAIGEKKRPALEQLLSGQKTEQVPVTALNNHPNVIVLTDIQIH